jgi:hypothetical protein
MDKTAAVAALAGMGWLFADLITNLINNSRSNRISNPCIRCLRAVHPTHLTYVFRTEGRIMTAGSDISRHFFEGGMRSGKELRGFKHWPPIYVQ